jgi:translocation and assembly module TamB
MSEPEITPPTSSEGTPAPARSAARHLRHILIGGGAVAVLAAIVCASLFLWACSSSFEEFSRNRLIAKIKTSTGGRVELASFHWRPLSFEAEVGGLVIHGRETTGEAPYARIEHLKVFFSIFGLWSPRIQLRNLEIDQPQIHLIVYPDGSTNQPVPPKQQKTGKSEIDSFFDLRAGHIAIRQGLIDYENRASDFDFQNRREPLNVDASDASLIASYVPANRGNPESYRIEAGVRDLNLLRGNFPQGSTSGIALPGTAKSEPVHGLLQAELDLTRSAAYLRFLRITARSRKVSDRTLEISGSLQNFSRPRWQAKVTGELDTRLLEPVTGYSHAPQGIARLSLFGKGEDGIFRADGGVHVDDGSYIGTGVVATGVGLDAQIHADPEQLLISSIVARLRQGGEIDGAVALSHWLSPLPGAATLQQATPPLSKKRGRRQAKTPVKPVQPTPDDTIPVNGKVTANFKGTALDTILEMVADPPFQHLGFDTLINGPASATWVNGDDHTLAVTAKFLLTPSAARTYTGSSAQPAKVPASGLIDATYTHRDGAVDLRLLHLQLPSSRLDASGHLGAYPIASNTAISVTLQSRNLSEFDTVLRNLNLKRNGKSGVSALPLNMAGEADFHGTWTGSLVDPHLSGSLLATQLAIEMPRVADTSPAQQQPAQSSMAHFDSIEATGSYSASRIAIDHGLLKHGAADIAFSGSLTAAAGTNSHGRTIPAYGGNSLLRLHLRANQIGIADLQPFIGKTLPVSGVLSTQLEAAGPLHALNGSGWVDIGNGSLYGESFSRLHAQGSLTNRTLKLASVTLKGSSGEISGNGSYDLNLRSFKVDAKGSNLELSRSKLLIDKGVTVTGLLKFSASGSGTLDDPRVEANAMLAGVTLAGEPLGNINLTAKSANRAINYQLATHMDSTQMEMKGRTALDGDYATQANLAFSHMNIGALLKMAHVGGISGESALAGTATIAGPLKRPEEMRGEVKLDEMAVSVSGVHLRSEGAVHATLANGQIHLDPLHILGEDTNLHAEGTLSLKDKKQLDFSSSGTINLRLIQTLDPDLTASGNSTFQIEAHGPLQNPNLRGRIDFQDGSLALEDLPNGLSQIKGTLEFNQNRLEIKSLTAMSGGGVLSIGGFLAYQRGIYADLSVTGKGIRVRYPEGVSSLADASLRLQGSQNNLLLSGNMLVTRFTVSTDLDLTALTATTNAVKTVVPQDAPSNNIRLDVHLTSSPQLNFQNAYAKLAGYVDLHLRGTVAAPSLLGRVSITEGNATIAGTRYELQHGDILFTNPVRIQPSIDINASARVEDYDITLRLQGTVDKPNVSYHSDPPLAEADVVALLALGRTQSQQRLYTQQQEQSRSNPTTDALLGGALNATVSSRVQRLFGAGSVKIDPNYLGALGNSTSRIIVEEQLGRSVTLTYATDVNTTGQQLLQAEVAINRHVSLLVARDESGVFSMVLKATRRYR